MNDTLTEAGRAALQAAAERNGFGLDAARALLDALVAGGGAQAQFGHPELGGMGQWSQGGMLMIGDMFNNGLKARVGALAADLAGLAADPSAFAAGPRGRGDWWPEGLGRPASVGAQNAMRYAVFPEARRLAVDRGGAVEIYDTGDHLIGGASQQQGGGQSLSFSSQLGAVALEGLRRLGATPEAPRQPEAAAPGPLGAVASPRPEAWRPAAETDRDPSPEAARSAPATADPFPATRPAAALPPEAPRAAPGQGTAAGDPIALIERLAELHGKGVLTDEEFAAKKKDLLARL